MCATSHWFKPPTVCLLLTALCEREFTRREWRSVAQPSWHSLIFRVVFPIYSIYPLYAAFLWLQPYALNAATCSSLRCLSLFGLNRISLLSARMDSPLQSAPCECVFTQTAHVFLPRSYLRAVSLSPVDIRFVLVPLVDWRCVAPMFFSL